LPIGCHDRLPGRAAGRRIAATTHVFAEQPRAPALI
jgi:hypothetical protein